MKAVVMRSGVLSLEDIEAPTPGPGQLLVEPLATGICGSDLSAWRHTADFLRMQRQSGAPGALFDPARGLVMGHEFTSRVLDVGADVVGYEPGELLVTLPGVTDAAGVPRTVGYSNTYPGALAERVVVQAYGHLRIPDGVCPYTAAVTEPMATGVNGVLRASLPTGVGALVTGCGPVGLGAVAELACRGVHPIVASDPSAVRRAGAADVGAHAAVDPAEDDPVTIWRDLAAAGQQLFVFEAAGSPGLLGRLFTAVPPYTRIMVVGVSTTHEPLLPGLGVVKNVSIAFVGGPDRDEPGYTAFARTFDHIAAGRIDPDRIVTGYTGLAGAPLVFEALRPREPRDIEDIKLLVRHDTNRRDICRDVDPG